MYFRKINNSLPLVVTLIAGTSIVFASGLSRQKHLLTSGALEARQDQAPNDCPPEDVDEWYRCAHECRAGECSQDEVCAQDCIHSLCLCICEGPDPNDPFRNCIWGVDPSGGGLVHGGSHSKSFFP